VIFRKKRVNPVACIPSRLHVFASRVSSGPSPTIFGWRSHEGLRTVKRHEPAAGPAGPDQQSLEYHMAAPPTLIQRVTFPRISLIAALLLILLSIPGGMNLLGVMGIMYGPLALMAFLP